VPAVTTFSMVVATVEWALVLVLVEMIFCYFDYWGD
jgi:hypothetical protein